MDRTIPSSGSEEIALYTRTYYSLLRSSREVKLKTLIEAHAHPIRAAHPCRFGRTGYVGVHLWTAAHARLSRQRCQAGRHGAITTRLYRAWLSRCGNVAARSSTCQASTLLLRRQSTLAVYIASRSDIDDIVPTLTAFQIERRKLRRRFRHDHVITLLEMRRKTGLSDNDLTALEDLTGVSADDLDRLQTIWQADTVDRLLSLARTKFALNSPALRIAGRLSSRHAQLVGTRRTSCTRNRLRRSPDLLCLQQYAQRCQRTQRLCSDA